MGTEPAICETDKSDIANLLIKYLGENNTMYAQNCMRLYFFV